MAPLLQLSEELRMLIIEECMNLPSELRIETLRRLRLTHPKFADSKLLKTHLFSTLVLKKSTPKDVLQYLAPYVREAILEPESNQDLASPRPSQTDEAPPDRPKEPFVWNLAPSLHILTNIQHVRISNPTYKGMGPRRIYRLGMYEKTPLLDDQFFRCAINSLNCHDTTSNLLGLYIGHAPSYHFAWFERFPEFRALALPNLQTLHFYPTVVPLDYRDATRLQQHSIVGETHPGPDGTLTKLLQKCSPLKLQELSLCCAALLFGGSWFKETPPAFPFLKKLHIERGCIHFERVTPWLHQSTSLQQLSVENVDLTLSEEPRSLNRWRPLFDAIRTHPNRLRVQLYIRCDLTQWHRWMPLTHDPSREEEQRGDETPDFFTHLRDYLSNRRDWPTQEEIDDAASLFVSRMKASLPADRDWPMQNEIYNSFFPSRG